MKEKTENIIRRHKESHISRRQIAQKLNLGPDDKAAFRKIIQELEEEGRLIRTKKNYYMIPGRADTVTGKLQCHRSGFGFLIPDPEYSGLGDVFLPASRLGDATHGDRVLVQISDAPATRGKRGGPPPKLFSRGPRKEGKVVKILERSHKKVIGKLLFLKRPVVIPLDSRFHYSVNVTNTDEFDLQDEDIVLVELTTEPSQQTRPEGRIVTFVGKPDDPDLPFKITIAKHDIPLEFSREAQWEARQIPNVVPADEIARRTDYRDLPAVTIDGETAFDFDDAVNVEQTPDGNFRLYVHIADVSHYVVTGTALDNEAFQRGTSVYFPDRAIPMLPSELSSTICSLLPEQDRLTLTAVLTIHAGSGKTMKTEFHAAVIRSRARMTYTEVARILDGDEETRRRHEALLSQFELMHALFTLLHRRRRRRGAIDFDLPEEEVRFDQMDNVIGIFKAQRNVAHRIIEEFMLAANEAVAQRFAGADLPFIYRIHEQPDPVKVAEFSEIAAQFGKDFQPDLENLQPRDFQQLADGFDDSPLGKYLTYLMLRSFKLAVYSEKNVGHFGLAAKDYTHFTSPIRRYPDLIVHRLLRAKFLHRKGARPDVPDEAGLGEIARHASERERAAVEAEREIMAWKKAEFMNEHIGEEFEGFVSSVRANGFYVELLDFFIEGFVNLSTMIDDYYEFREEELAFRGERTNRVFRLGTPVLVKVDRVDMQRFLLDFSVSKVLRDPQAPPAGKPKAVGPRKKGSRKKGGKKK
ncbi:MAG: ribonuclease R [Acidobacteria bacterium]|nr:ribonuclease R [Acidobacteriota bacterium]